MTESATKAMRSTALALVAGSAVVAVGLAWKRYGRLDPYSSVTKKSRPSNPATSIQAGDVTIRHYENGKLVAKADAKGLTMDQSRSGIVLDKIKNGLMQTKQGPMQFAAGTGVLRPDLKMVDVSNGVRVKGADFDVTSSMASINGRKGELVVPKSLFGKIAGKGDFNASSLVHRPNTSYTLIKDPHYRGKLPDSVELPAARQDRVWDMKGDTAEQKGTQWVYTDARASDGEVIVMAPTIEQNTKTDVITATGRATYRSAKADMIADKVVVYRKEGRAEFFGNVVMLVRPKRDWEKPLPKDEEGLKPLAVNLPGEPAQGPSPAEKQRDEDLRSGKTIRDYPLNMKADTMTYWYRKGQRHGIAKGSDATAYQKFEDGRWWRQVTAPEAHYDAEKDMLDLLGDTSKRQVRMKNSIGDDVQAIAATMSTKEDQTEDDEYKKFKSPSGKVVDRGDSDDPRGAPETKPTDPKKTPPVKTEPPTKTPPPAKTGP